MDAMTIQKFAIPGLLLMESAGRGCAELLVQECLSPQKVCILCGKGNNAGDGLVIARYLSGWGYKVEVWMIGQPKGLPPDAAINYEIIRRLGLSVQIYRKSAVHRLKKSLSASNWVIDALLGTGLKGAVRSPYDSVIKAVNASGKKVLAVDVPSGLDADSGKPAGGAVRADITATLGLKKAGMLKPGASQFCGRIEIIDIGFPRQVLHAKV